jgi:aspartate aminotransferase
MTAPLRQRQLEESPTLALTDAARKLTDAGADIVSLTAGEPDFPTPAHVKKAAIAAVQANFTRYTPNQGIPELVEAVRWKFATDNHLAFDEDQILVSSGAKQSVFNTIMALCAPGDEVLLLSPYWVSYPGMIKLAHAVPVIVPTLMSEGFLPDPDRIRHALTRRTRALIINTPGNPTGAVYPRQVLEQIAEIAAEHDLTVISDEIYEKILYEESVHLSIGAMEAARDQVVTVNGLSKAYAMTGWRIGFLGGPRDLVRGAAMVQSQTTSNANSIAQRAAIAALRGPQDEIHFMQNQYARRRTYIINRLGGLPRVGFLPPRGAIYGFLHVAGLSLGQRAGPATGTRVASHLLDDYRVALVPGGAFGNDEFIRFSFSCPQSTLEKGIDRIRDGLLAIQ